jgi:integrase
VRPARAKTKVDPWTIEEAARFLLVIAGHPLEAPITVAMFLGLRQSEVLGLRWSDIDFDKAELTVAGQLDRSTHQHVPTKTPESVRPVSIDKRTLAQLRAQRTRQKEASLAVGPGNWPDTGFVFTRADGTAIRQEHLYRTFVRLGAQVGLRHQRFHDLRHMAASFQLAAGASMAEIAQLLGHSDRSRITERYAHLYPEVRKAAAARIDSLFPVANDG